MSASECPLCHGEGEVELRSSTEVSDSWLAELKQYCVENPKGTVPVAYAAKLVDEIWELTHVAIQASREVVELKIKNGL